MREMTPEHCKMELVTIRKVYEIALTNLNRKRNMRDSERAMTAASYNRRIQAINMAIASITKHVN